METKGRNSDQLVLLNLYFLFACLLLLSSMQVNGQTESTPTVKYSTWIRLTGEPYDINGTLCLVTDSSLSLLEPKVTTPGYFRLKVDNTFSAGRIETIMVRRKGSVGKGAIIGLFTGFSIGLIAGLVQGNDPKEQWVHSFTAPQKGLLLGTMFGGIGAGIGASIGALKIKFSVNGDIQTFENINKKLRQYSLQQCVKE